MRLEGPAECRRMVRAFMRYQMELQEVERLTIRSIKLRCPRANAIRMDRALRSCDGRWYVSATAVHADTLELLTVKLSAVIE